MRGMLNYAIQPIWQQFIALSWSALKKPSWDLNFLHIFAVPSSSRHEKCCQILERLFVVFHHSKNIPWFQQASSLQIGLLNDSVLELKGLCHNMMQNSKNCPFCNNDHHPSTLQQTETMNLKLKQREADMKKKEEEIVSLQSQVSNGYNCLTLKRNIRRWRVPRRAS